MVVQKETEIKNSKEIWSYYDLDDGTILKIKTILISVYDAGADLQGNPSINLQTANVIGVTPQTDTFEPLDEKKDLQFKEKYDNPWNEYTLDNDYILMLKPTITQVDRTGKYDLRGIPLYIIQSQVAAKVKT
jgi:hypothetical protein